MAESAKSQFEEASTLVTEKSTIKIGPGIELLGFQTQVPGTATRDAWIEPQEGLTILYGKNGTGKTSILDSLEGLLLIDVPVEVTDRCRSRRNHKSRGYFGLTLSIATMEMICSTLSDFKQFLWAGKDDDLEGDLEDQFKTWILSDMEDDEVSPKFEELINALAEYIAKVGVEAFKYVDEIFSAIKEKLITEFKTGEHRYVSLGECEASLNRFDLSLVAVLDLDRAEHDDDAAIPIEVIENSTWEGLMLLNLFTWLDELDGIVSNENLVDDCFYIADAIENGIIQDRSNLSLNDLLEDPLFLHKMLVEAYQKSLEQPIFSFCRVGPREFEINLALALDGEYAPGLQEFLLSDLNNLGAKNNAEESVARLSMLWQQLIVHRETEMPKNFWDENVFDICDRTFKFLCLRPGFPIATLRCPPLWAMSLDFLKDPQEVATEALQRAVSRDYGDVTVLLDNSWRETGATDVSSIDLKEFEETVLEAARICRQFDIGITDIQIELSGHLVKWAEGKAIDLKFKTDLLHDEGVPSGAQVDGIAFDSLSQAQQYWVKVALQVATDVARDDTVIYLADEPEAGLHERAAHRVFATLSTLGINGLVVSHSISALRQQSANLIHIERDSEGAVVVASVGIGADVADAANRLGTSTFDLLALKRVLLIVEGAHDGAVVDRLVELSQVSRLRDMTLTAVARGVRNVAQAADSVIVTEFTELQILALVDNGRAKLLSEFLSKARQLVSSGVPHNKVAKIVLAEQQSVDPSPEERFLFDLIVRAVERGITDRLHVYALPVKDIIELLPYSAFGLTKEWTDLRGEYERSRSGEDFKGWLRNNHQAEISTRRISEAFDSLDSLPAPLIEVLREIELLSALGSLN